MLLLADGGDAGKEDGAADSWGPYNCFHICATHRRALRHSVAQLLCFQYILERVQLNSLFCTR